MADPVWRPASEPPEDRGLVLAVVRGHVVVAAYLPVPPMGPGWWVDGRLVHPTAWLPLPLPGAPGEACWGGGDGA